MFFKDIPTISAKDLIAKLTSDEPTPPIVLDARTRLEWNLSHIPNAVLAGHWLEASLQPNQLVVCVCLSAHRSKPLTDRLIKQGINAVELQGGMLAWWKAGLPTEKS